MQKHKDTFPDPSAEREVFSAPSAVEESDGQESIDEHQVRTAQAALQVVDTAYESRDAMLQREISALARLLHTKGWQQVHPEDAGVGLSDLLRRGYSEKGTIVLPPSEAGFPVLDAETTSGFLEHGGRTKCRIGVKTYASNPEEFRGWTPVKNPHSPEIRAKQEMERRGFTTAAEISFGAEYGHEDSPSLDFIFVDQTRAEEGTPLYLHFTTGETGIPPELKAFHYPEGAGTTGKQMIPEFDGTTEGLELVLAELKKLETSLATQESEG